MDETIYSESNVGQRLSKMRREESMFIAFNGKEIPLVSRIIIGRSKRCNIVIDDKLASREHSLVQKIQEAYFIKDLESTNGTRVNGKAVPTDKFQKLSPGDVITIGRTELRIL